MLYIDKEKLPIIMSFGLGYGYCQLLPMISSHPLLQGGTQKDQPLAQ